MKNAPQRIARKEDPWRSMNRRSRSDRPDPDVVGDAGLVTILASLGNRSYGRDGDADHLQAVAEHQAGGKGVVSES